MFPIIWPHYVAGCACQVHAAIQACQDYCQSIDEDWVKVADWYKLGQRAVRGERQGQLYREHLGRVARTLIQRALK